MKAADLRVPDMILPSEDARDRVAARIAANPVQGSPEEMRRAFDALFPDAPRGRASTIGGRPCVVHGEGDRGTVVWLHGGGYVLGGARSHGAAAACLARLAQCRVVLPLYRRAPENTWPAPLEDALAVIDALDGPVALVGDSAGGHLALAVARGRPGAIRAMALVSPNTDRTGLSTSRKANSSRDLMNSDADDARFAAMAMPGFDPRDPDVSPLVADLAALPRTFLVASTCEVLLDDSLLLGVALARAGVQVETHILPGLWHLWPLWPGQLAEADDTLARIAAFLTRPGLGNSEGPRTTA